MVCLLIDLGWSIVFLFSILIYGLVLWLLKLEPDDKDFWSGLTALRGEKEQRV